MGRLDRAHHFSVYLCSADIVPAPPAKDFTHFGIFEIWINRSPKDYDRKTWMNF